MHNERWDEVSARLESYRQSTSAPAQRLAFDQLHQALGRPTGVIRTKIGELFALRDTAGNDWSPAVTNQGMLAEMPGEYVALNVRNRVSWSTLDNFDVDTDLGRAVRTALFPETLKKGTSTTRGRETSLLTAITPSVKNYLLRLKKDPDTAFLVSGLKTWFGGFTSTELMNSALSILEARLQEALEGVDTDEDNLDPLEAEK